MSKFAVTLAIAGALVCGASLGHAQSSGDTAARDGDAPHLADDWVDLLMFVDVYGLVDWRFPKPQTETGPTRGFDFATGFALQWAGVDLTLRRGPVSGTVAVRYGPSVPRLMGRGELDIKQAFATWLPSDKVTLDLGVFDTLYGAEGANSFDNLNYSVGTLFFVGQPFYHTGLRVGYQVAPTLKLGGVLVNGWNSFTDNNRGKTVGVQATWDAHPNVTTTLGYIAGPEQDDAADSDANGRFRHFVDFITVAKIDALEIWFNADIGVEEVLDATGTETILWWGALAAVRYHLTEKLAASGRVEYFADPDAQLLGTADLSLATFTATLEARPHPLLIFRLEGRVDAASDPIYPDGATDTSSTAITSVLGVVVRTP